MPRPGRPSPEREKQIKASILELTAYDSPGMTFTQLVGRARKQGISKPALWRHLTRFVKLGLVLHEGKFYRRNPLYGFVTEPKFLPSTRTEFEHPSAHIRLTLRTRPGPSTYKELTHLTQEHCVDPWSSRSVVLESRVMGPEELYLSLSLMLSLVLNRYLSLLGIICNIQNLAAARELANIVMDSNVAKPLMVLARDIWEHRNEVSLETLKGKELNFSIDEELSSSQERHDSTSS